MNEWITTSTTIALGAILILFLTFTSEFFLIHRLILLIYLRGLMIPNQFWWNISELLSNDLAGAKLFHQFRKESDQKPFKQIWTLGHSYYLVLKTSHVKEMLDNSPWIFGVGRLKYDFFKSFMPGNVGVSQGCPWKIRRIANEQVLFTDKTHLLLVDAAAFFNKNKLPYNFQTFSQLAQKLSLKLTFGDITDTRIFEMFREANQLAIFREKDLKLSSYQYFVKAFDQTGYPVNSLVGMARTLGMSEKELLQQAPHWLFPINGVVTVSLPRVLALLATHPEQMRLIREEIEGIDEVEDLLSRKSSSLRRCIMETLRLNNTVVSMFRTLLEDYQFKDGTKFTKGTNFLILIAGFLRDANVFPNPDSFIPDRWLDKELEESYSNLIWSQGPQRCPGRELSIQLLELGVWSILKRTSKVHVKGNTPNLNPFKLEFSY